MRGRGPRGRRVPARRESCRQSCRPPQAAAPASRRFARARGQADVQQPAAQPVPTRGRLSRPPNPCSSRPRTAQIAGTVAWIVAHAAGDTRPLPALRIHFHQRRPKGNRSLEALPGMPLSMGRGGRRFRQTAAWCRSRSHAPPHARRPAHCISGGCRQPPGTWPLTPGVGVGLPDLGWHLPGWSHSSEPRVAQDDAGGRPGCGASGPGPRRRSSSNAVGYLVGHEILIGLGGLWGCPSSEY